MVRIVSLILLALCVTGYLAQESQESAEAGGQGGGGGGGANQSAEEEGNAGGGNGNLPPGGVINPGGDNLNPLELTGRRLQIFNARLDFVRRELNILGPTIGRFLFFGDEQTDRLTEEFQLSLEVALFPPPPPPETNPLPPPLQPFPFQPAPGPVPPNP